MFLNKKSFICFLTAGLLVLTGCQAQNASSQPINPSTSPSNSQYYYNENNFEKDARKVTATTLVTYDGPEFLDQYSGVKISVADKDLFVYKTRVNHDRIFSWNVPDTYAPLSIFDFEGKVNVKIKVENKDISSVKISPQVYGIEPLIQGDTISFNLEYPDNYVVEYNGEEENAIHLFASELEKNPITAEDAKNDDSIIYIGPGVYKADAIPVKSNSTIYLAGGAYVYGQIRTEGLENITIRGRGIISGSIYDRLSVSQYTIPIEIRSSKNIKIEDLTFLDPAGWTIALYKSKDVVLNNVKIISARQNGDGISVQSCENVLVNGGFIRTWDDSLVVKNVDRGSTNNVKFKGCYVWTDLAQSMEVGYETYGPTMNDITFEDITIFHNYHKAAISLHNCDDANISNVTYKNITIEDGSMLGDNQQDGLNDFLFDFTIAYNIDWTKSEGIRGTVDTINIENIKIYNLKDTIISRIMGESQESSIKNVSIKDVEINNKKIQNLSEFKIADNSFVSNITYESKNEVLGSKIYLPYTLDLQNSEISKTEIKNISQDGMLVPDFAISQSEAPYIGVPSSIKGTINATHGAGTKTTTPGDDGSGDFTADSYDAINIYDKDLNTSWVNKDWKNEDNEFACLTIEFDELITIGVVRILGSQDNKFYSTYSVQVWGKKIKSDGSINDKYTRLSSTKDYEMSPSKNNLFDINITAQQYKGIQLRLYRGSSSTSTKNYKISEIQFYQPSLAYNKAIVESTEHNDVYNIEKLVDGDPTGTSYYESKNLPAEIVIDLGALYNVTTFVLSLPPSLLWEARTETIEILGSDSNLAYDKEKVNFKTLVPATDYLFDPTTGNRNIVKINPEKVRFIKLIISSNDTKGGYNAQLSEFSVYGE